MYVLICILTTSQWDKYVYENDDKHFCETRSPFYKHEFHCYEAFAELETRLVLNAYNGRTMEHRTARKLYNHFSFGSRICCNM